MTSYLKDPAAELVYTIDWTANYLIGDNILASSWRVEPLEQGGIAILGTELAANVTRIRVGGGIPGHVYQLANHITLAGGESDERTITVRIGDR